MIATYNKPDGEIIEWDYSKIFPSSNKWSRERAFNEFKNVQLTCSYFIRDSNGVIDWDTPIYPTMAEIDQEYQFENFQIGTIQNGIFISIN